MPPLLKTGDTIGVLSTARKISRKAIEPVRQAFQRWGFRVEQGHTIGAEWHQFAGDDETRARDLQQMLDNPAIKAVVAAKGGYGTIRILDKVDFSAFQQHPKWICGFSDVTVLHSFLNHCLGISSVHSPMASIPDEQAGRWDALNTLKNALTGRDPVVTAEPHLLNRFGQASGTVIGGNLSILYSLLGTAETFDPSGKILFLEEVDEYLYHVDRMLWSLRRAGKFEHLSGIAIGSLSDMKDNEIPFGTSAMGLVHEHISGFSGPVAFGLPAGHVPFNHSLYLGARAQLTVDANGTALQYERGAE